MDVVRDVLDKLVRDRNGREMGRVDGIVLEQREGEPPRLSAVLIGPSALGYRVHPTIGRWAAALEHAFGIERERPTRIAFGDIKEIDADVTINRPVGETGVGVVEQRVRAWVVKIPGAS